MTKQTRRRFSPEYKERSVARLSQPGATHSSVAAELGVTPTQLKTWRLELEAAGSLATGEWRDSFLRSACIQPLRSASTGALSSWRTARRCSAALPLIPRSMSNSSKPPGWAAFSD